MGGKSTYVKYHMNKRSGDKIENKREDGKVQKQSMARVKNTLITNPQHCPLYYYTLSFTLNYQIERGRYGQGRGGGGGGLVSPRRVLSAICL